MQGPHEERITYLTFWMLPIVGGPFRMGSKKKDKEAWDWEKPDHDVTVRDFHLGQFPVTQDLWRAVAEASEASVGVTLSHADTTLADTTLDPNPSFFEGDRRPVEQVSWDDAQAFIQKLNALTAKSRPDGLVYRLPTEAEWEYAAKGGIHTSSSTKHQSEAFPLPNGEGRGGAYSGSDKLNEVGWYADNSHGETKPVGLKLPNALGLYDMSGNVWEWCEDDWHGDYKKGPKDGSAWVDTPERGTYRVYRGGSWVDTPRGCRSAYRTGWLPGDRGYDIGFRLALAPQSVG